MTRHHMNQSNWHVRGECGDPNGSGRAALSSARRGKSLLATWHIWFSESHVQARQAGDSSAMLPEERLAHPIFDTVPRSTSLKSRYANRHQYFPLHFAIHQRQHEAVQTIQTLGI